MWLEFAATALEKWWESKFVEHLIDGCPQSGIQEFIAVPHGAFLGLSKAVDGRKVVFA